MIYRILVVTLAAFGCFFLDPGAEPTEASFPRCRPARQHCCGPVIELEPKTYKRTSATASSIRVQGSWNATQTADPNALWVIANSSTYKVKDTDNKVDVRVDVTLDPGSTMEAGYPKLKVFGDETSAKNALVYPPDGAAMSMSEESGTLLAKTYRLNNVMVVSGAEGTVTANNNWIVIWTGSVTGNQYFDIHRLPSKGSSLGWRIEFVR